MAREKPQKARARPTEDDIRVILEDVAAGRTLRQIAGDLGVSAYTVLKWVTSDETLEKRYARARELASDIFELDIHEAAMAASPETAAADRVRIDALKWIAARRAPKRYGDRVTHEGGETPQRVEFSWALPNGS